MKKILSVILALAVIISLSVPAFSADTDKMQSILEKVKERIGDTADFENFSSETNNINGKKNYRFSWGDEDSSKYRDMSLTVDEAGIISNYNYYWWSINWS